MDHETQRVEREQEARRLRAREVAALETIAETLTFVRQVAQVLLREVLDDHTTAMPPTVRAALRPLADENWTSTTRTTSTPTTSTRTTTP